ncbi:hypothetical protein EIP91_006370 [Steccherinum ochraceum]|uniref:Acyl-CoA oxidase C-alpha1 domain-containing protein n=1 Tax=Steccherinum ochraceum TaxID=92696 RepID=A0A4R0RE77_9APHY|nr:hypothetical protein EIP91_006370 [Steccherinum ochraceum]
MAHIFIEPIPEVVPTLELAQTPLYKILDKNLDLETRTQVVYDRARALSRAYALTAEDVIYLRPKFWALHMDLIAPKDAGAFTLVTIQYNLVAGTVGPHALRRPELRPLLQQILDFDVSAQFLMSEVGHGLDAPHMETTATLLPDGSFDLHTPSPRAAKHMPPTGPFGNMPRVAVVMARLMVNGEDHGIRPFIAALNDGKEMCKGISAKLMPSRAGLNPVDHALTYFDHVHLPKEALLGSLDKPRDLRQNFLDIAWRVSVGSLALSVLAVPALRNAVYIAGKYSIRRTVTGPDGKPLPIIAFRTQQLPILHTLAQTYVLEAYSKDTIQRFLSPDLDPRVRHGITAVLKTVMVEHCQSDLFSLAERCGAQGLFEHNEIIQIQLASRGIAIAEGDVLALCIRKCLDPADDDLDTESSLPGLASELLIGRYDMPEPADPSSLLARHELGLFEETRTLVMNLGSGHRTEAFNRLVLPLCQPLIEAIGHRMAYDAAVKAKVPQDLVDMYVANALKHDPTWYIEHAGLTRREIAQMEDRAASAMLPKLEVMLEATGSAPYVHAPIVSDENWKAFLDTLPHFGGNAVVNVIPGTEQGVADTSAAPKL